MKDFFLPKFNKLLVLFLTILGFACDSNDPVVEYGAPSATFKVNGNIVDEVSLEKISNIQVVLQNMTSSSMYSNDTVYSDENGNYQVELVEFPSSQAFLLKFEDVDGVRGGSYLNADSAIVFEDPEFVNGDGSWYAGETSQEVNVKLTPNNDL